MKDVEVASKCRKAKLIYGDIDLGFAGSKTLRPYEKVKGERVNHKLSRICGQVHTAPLKHR